MARHNPCSALPISFRNDPLCTYGVFALSMLAMVVFQPCHLVYSQSAYRVEDRQEANDVQRLASHGRPPPVHAVALDLTARDLPSQTEVQQASVREPVHSVVQKIGASQSSFNASSHVHQTRLSVVHRPSTTHSGSDGQLPLTVRASSTSPPKQGTPSRAEGAIFAQKWPFQWKVGGFRVHSTVSSDALRSASTQLLALPPQIEATLAIKLRPSEVHLVVLNDETEYEHYVKSHFPNLPSRRALYVQRRGMGVVITYFHADWLTDARHECTHALFHQSGIQLPLWLEEGISEYFENHTADRRFHPEHRPAIETQLRFGQIAQIADLEDNATTKLDAKGYRDAWGVVAFMIHHNDETRLALSNYINDLHRGTAAGYLSRRLSLDTRRNWRYHYEQFYTTPSE